MRIVVTRNEGLEINTAEFPDLAPSALNVGLRADDFQLPRECRRYKVVVEALPE